MTSLIKRRSEWHESVTDDRIEARARAGMFDLDSPGICICCGQDAEGVEPDARAYRCESCGARGPVYGAAELLIRNRAMKIERNTETYLGDGVYASFDGWSVKLRTPREEGDHVIFFEPREMRALTQYLDAVLKLFDEAKRPPATPKPS
jgi:hypothetical protein